MSSEKNPEDAAGSKSALDALPVSSNFNIDFTSEESFRDELNGYLISGEITIGSYSTGFTLALTQGSWDTSDFYRQWREAAERLLSGHDRSAFVINTGAAGWGTVFGGRWLAWREGERVYMAADDTPSDSFDEDHPYSDIKSLRAASSQGADNLLALNLQAFRDYLSSRGVEPSRLRELERSCEQCGKEMRRCNRCEGCMNCGGGLGEVELGYCVKCQNISEPLAPVNEQPSTDEANWLECGEGGVSYAISLLRDDPSNHRKLFLAGCAWARRFWERLGKRSRTSVEVFERFADGDADRGDFMIAFTEAGDAWHAATAYMDDPDAEREIVLPARGVLSLGRRAYIDASDEFSFASGEKAAELQAQCEILRDVFGDPSRPVSLEEDWLSRNEEAVRKLAQTIYDERSFDRLPELADALERSGCHNPRILEHCRSQGPHVRGCWVIDLLLGKDKLAFLLG